VEPNPKKGFAGARTGQDARKRIQDPNALASQTAPEGTTMY
jgi:hypothetical protein